MIISFFYDFFFYMLNEIKKNILTGTFHMTKPKCMTTYPTTHTIKKTGGEKNNNGYIILSFGESSKISN